MSIPFPIIRFASWDASETDPVGSRHIESGAFAYDKTVGLGCDAALAIDGLRLNLTTGDTFVESDVAVLNFAFPNFGELTASGITTINNIRMWLPAGSGSVLDVPGISLQYQTSQTWIQNPSFPSGAGNEFPTTIPGSSNIRRIDGSEAITSFNDANVSEWIYLRVFMDANFPVGTYGICGSGLLRPRLTYDFF